MGLLDGKFAVITGAGSGMGRATTAVFVREGATMGGGTFVLGYLHNLLTALLLGLVLLWMAPGASYGARLGTVVVAVFATASKYPRHHTGGFYFDTASVVLRFASIGSAPVPVEVNLRIPLP